MHATARPTNRDLLARSSGPLAASPAPRYHLQPSCIRTNRLDSGVLAEHPTRGLSPTLSQKQKHVMHPRARVQNGCFSMRGEGGKSAYSAPKAHQVRRHNPKPHLDQERNLVPPPHRQIRPAVNLATPKASSESAHMVSHPVNRAAHGERCALCRSSGSSNGGLAA